MFLNKTCEILVALEISIKCKEIVQVSEVKYLEEYLSEDFYNTHMCMLSRIKGLYTRGNILWIYFKLYSKYVKIKRL